ncbi:MAG: hypothetical protein HYZ51_03380 [Candidatus Doudnabacteria bacterium]|nr:hypothetical protein [Candidatus Doudnabacteria bacterium]
MALELKDYDPALMQGANVGVSVDLTDITDFAGNEVIEIDGVASAVNFLRATNGATGSSAALSAQGDDTNVGLELSSKGTGSVILWSGNSAREILIGVDTASAVNELTITPAATTANPLLAASGSDTNIGLDLSSKGTGSITLWTGNRAREVLIGVDTASAVNEFTITPAATTAAVKIAASGGDTNISAIFAGKGTGAVHLGQATSSDVRLLADQPLADSSGNEYFKFSKAASAVNEVTVSNAATTTPPVLAATGGDTNISLRLTAKGTGCIQTTQPLVEEMTQTAVTDTATLTIAQLLTKVIDGTPTAAATYTLPTAALLVGGIANAQVGDSFQFFINNKSGGANTITVAAGTGGTTDGTLTVAQDVIRAFLIIVTNVTGASEAYFVYGIV